MNWTIDSGPMPSHIRIETSGEASIESFAAMWDDILASPHWRADLTVLMDNRNLHGFRDPDQFTTAAIEYFAKNALRLGRSCIASISTEPTNFKYARQFQYGIRLHGSNVVLQVFGSETQAVEWLNHYASLRGNDDPKVVA
jgi:hypothetical protein